jgi:hypothetical protein
MVGITSGQLIAGHDTEGLATLASAQPALIEYGIIQYAGKVASAERVVQFPAANTSITAAANQIGRGSLPLIDEPANSLAVTSSSASTEVVEMLEDFVVGKKIIAPEGRADILNDIPNGIAVANIPSLITKPRKNA